jgi:nucleoside-diphosphate-sugar epimerase
MKSALVTGSSGFVGRALVAELRRRGYAVQGAVRNKAGREAEVASIEVGDLSGATDWSRALRGVDTVFHLAARVHRPGEHDGHARQAYVRENVDATIALAEAAAAAGVERLIFVSSVKVMGESSPGRPFRESDPPAPQDAYGRSKLDAERALAALGGRLEVTVVRPPLVYGPGVRANFLGLLRLAASGWPLPLGAARAKRSLVFVDNLVDALITCATQPHGCPATYFAADGDDFSVREIVDLLRSEMRMPRRLWTLPQGLAAIAAQAIGRGDAVQRLFRPLQVDTERIRRSLGWSPPVAAEDGIRATARWFMQARAQERL